MAHAHYVGIDPGLEGALALTGPNGFLSFADTPKIAAAGKSKQHYDEHGMVRALRLLLMPDVLIVIEKVHSMPQQSSVSTFTFGTGYGIWLGIIAALGVPSVRVDPRTWKKVCLKDVPKDDLAAQAASAGRAYPAAAPLLLTPRGRVLDGRTDALLLAHYGRVSGL
jgi:hypothetical protein